MVMGTSTFSRLRWLNGPKTDLILTILMLRRGSFTVMVRVISEGRFFHVELGFTRHAWRIWTAMVCSMCSISRTIGKHRAWTYGYRCVLMPHRTLVVSLRGFWNSKETPEFGVSQQASIESHVGTLSNHSGGSALGGTQLNDATTQGDCDCLGPIGGGQLFHNVLDVDFDGLL